MPTLTRRTAKKRAAHPPTADGPMTYEQFLAEATIHPHSEWVDGYVMPLGDRPPHAPRRPPMSYEQFLADPTIEPHSEWVDGEVIPMPPVHEAQNDEDVFLSAVLKVYVDINGLGAIYREPFQMKAAADLPGRAPDLFFVKKRNRKRVRGTRLEGPADLVIEIVSPESQTRDRVHKFSEYERGGVPEFWLIDPDRRTADFLLRGRNGKFRAAPVTNGVYHSKAVKGFWLKVEWLWRRPSTAYVLKQLGAI